MELDGLVRTGGRALAASRIALGMSALVSPRLAATPWVGWSSTDPAGTVLGRAAGARDIALGAGALLAVRQGARAERTWVALAAFCDVADAATTVAHWRRLPSPGRLLVSARPTVLTSPSSSTRRVPLPCGARRARSVPTPTVPTPARPPADRSPSAAPDVTGPTCAPFAIFS